MSLKKAQIVFKPFEYPWAYDAWLLQQQIHWLPEEVPLADDVLDWRRNLTASERNLLTQIFRFFTQSDIEVNNNYMSNYTQVFQSTEIRMMLSAFSNIETVHIAAYSHLLDTIGMPEAEYAAFLNYDEMKNKYDYMHGFGVNSDEDIALNLAAFGAFTEGLQLFASFAILLNFQRFGKMKGMGQIVSWSARDESLHTESIIRLFHTFIKENPSVDTPKLRTRLVEICQDIIRMEDAFIDLAFGIDDIKGITAQEVKQYIRYIGDVRLRQLGQMPVFNIKDNPLPWMSEILNGLEHANFFENRVTEYTKAATRGTWEEAFV
jgi:ribonucleoside-diphosphate reductase beta chain